MKIDIRNYLILFLMASLLMLVAFFCGGCSASGEIVKKGEDVHVTRTIIAVSATTVFFYLYFKYPNGIPLK